MANATTQVAASKPSCPSERITEHGLDSAAGTVPQGVLVGRNAAGYFVNAGDSVSLTEIGLNTSPSVTVNANRGHEFYKVAVERGIVVPMTIATLSTLAAARALLGAPLFAAYNNEVTLSPGTYANFVGFLAGVVSVTEVEVYIPLYPEGSESSVGRKVGSYTTPKADPGTDEWEEIHVATATATLDKPMMRFRRSNSVNMTAGSLTSVHIQAYSGSGLNVASLQGARIEAGMKGATGVALATGAIPHCACQMKIEDDYATNGQAVGGPTWTGAVAVLSLQAQLSSSPTGAFDAIFIDCQAAVNGTPNAFDSIIHVRSGGQNGAIANLIQFDAASTCCVVAGGTYSTADGYFLVKVGANTYRVPFFTAVD